MTTKTWLFSLVLMAWNSGVCSSEPTPNPSRSAGPEKVSITVQSPRDELGFGPTILAGRQPLSLDIRMAATQQFAPGTLLAIEGQEIFSGHMISNRVPLGIPSRNGQSPFWAIDLSPTVFPLTPGCWKISMRLHCAEATPSNEPAATLLVYARTGDESLYYTLASWDFARMEQVFDAKAAIYGTTICIEIQHDSGLAYLYGAHMFRALGQNERAAFCERGIRRVSDVVIGRMLDPSRGRIWGLADRAGNYARSYAVRQQECLAMKFICQAYFYFRFGPNPDLDYARHLLAALEPAFNFQIQEPLIPGCGDLGFTVTSRKDSWDCTPGCGDYGCKVYDGRILAGLAWYCLAYHAEHGKWPTSKGIYPDPASRVANCAEMFVRQLLSHQGWYDSGCLRERGVHVFYGNMNLLMGLLPVRRMMCIMGGTYTDGGTTRAADDGIHEAFRFITHTSASVTGESIPVLGQPKLGHVDQWATCAVYEMCEEYLTTIQEDRAIRYFQERFARETAFMPVDDFALLNVAGALLALSDEYRALPKKPVFPWWQSESMGSRE